MMIEMVMKNKMRVKVMVIEMNVKVMVFENVRVKVMMIEMVNVTVKETRWCNSLW